MSDRCPRRVDKRSGGTFIRHLWGVFDLLTWIVCHVNTWVEVRQSQELGSGSRSHTAAAFWRSVAAGRSEGAAGSHFPTVKLEPGARKALCFHMFLRSKHLREPSKLGFDRSFTSCQASLTCRFFKLPPFDSEAEESRLSRRRRRRHRHRHHRVYFSEAIQKQSTSAVRKRERSAACRHGGGQTLVELAPAPDITPATSLWQEQSCIQAVGAAPGAHTGPKVNTGQQRDQIRLAY